MKRLGLRTTRPEISINDSVGPGFGNVAAAQ